MVQGMVRAALGRLRERYAGRARELGEARLSLQESLDSGAEALTERTEENAMLALEVRPRQCPISVDPGHGCCGTCMRGGGGSGKLPG